MPFLSRRKCGVRAPAKPLNPAVENLLLRISLATRLTGSMMSNRATDDLDDDRTTSSRFERLLRCFPPEFRLSFGRRKSQWPVSTRIVGLHCVENSNSHDIDQQLTSAHNFTFPARKHGLDRGARHRNRETLNT